MPSTLCNSLSNCYCFFNDKKQNNLYCATVCTKQLTLGEVLDVVGVGVGVPPLALPPGAQPVPLQSAREVRDGRPGGDELHAVRELVHQDVLGRSEPARTNLVVFVLKKQKIFKISAILYQFYQSGS